MNDGIAPELCHVQLASVDDTIQHVVLLGHQSQMAKIDVAHAYRNVPVHASPRPVAIVDAVGGEGVY